MKKVISFSLWGSDPKYTFGALENVKLSKKIYPDWVCRFYIGSSTPVNIMNQLKSFDNCEVIEMNEIGDWTGMFWRFYACEDSDVMISRDTDSRVSTREKLAVEEWLNSDKDFHIMRDHPWHTTEILGGMWGCRNGILKGITKNISEYKKGNFWQVDQNFLREIIYPNVKDNCFVHDSFFSYDKNSKKFPSVRVNREFVGDVFDDKNQRHEEYFKYV